MDEGENWNNREAQSGIPSTSSDDQSTSYAMAGTAHSLYQQYGVDSGFQLLVDQAGLYQPVRSSFDGISSSDGSQPVDLQQPVNSDDNRTFALQQIEASNNLQLYSTSNEASSEALPLVSQPSTSQNNGQPGTLLRLQTSHSQEYSNEPDTTQQEEIDQSIASDADLSLSDSGVDSGPSSTVVVVDTRRPTASTVQQQEAVLSLDTNISSSQQIVTTLHESDLLASVSAESGLEQEPSTSGTIECGEAVQDSNTDDDLSVGILTENVDDEVPLAEAKQNRRSARVSQMENITTCSTKAIYEPVPYNVLELWCEVCQKSYLDKCPTHSLQFITDKLVLTRAWASLPPLLQVYRNEESKELGVFAKRHVPEQTQFGPFVACFVENKDMVTNQKFILQVERDEGIRYIESSNEDECNWMMFVRSADNYSEQNCVAYQHGPDIFFTTIRGIEPKQELKVWYSAHYAHHIGAELHQVNEQILNTIMAQESQWSCYECSCQFPTSAQLQAHLSVHDEPLTRQAADDDFYIEDKETSRHRRKGLTLRLGRPRGRPPGRKSKDVSDSFQSWKKKKTSLYLSRLKKSSGKTKQSLRSLYKKKEHDNDSGEISSEWTCVHCELTFDSPSLLNLHTLTHAAEDVGLDEILRHNEEQTTEGMESRDSAVGTTETDLDCPVCKRLFTTKKDLIEHASEHARTRSTRGVNPNKPHKCSRCWKSFSTLERLQKHTLCHGKDASKPLECNICFKRFMNNSAIAGHMKTHGESKFYQCLLCQEEFNQAFMLKKHVLVHEVNSYYICPHCDKSFDDYNQTRKHIRTFHSMKKYPCPQCEKVFPRPDKLKLHMLRHSNHREFMCETCGRQFKRKDKLKEHMKRMHSEEREAARVNRPASVPGKKFVPKVSPMDFHRFIYKCHACLLGFKRRGMLVNHLAKRHPETKPEAVPELNLPILRTQKDYYCQYCEKVYKSSSKRKSHILKNHPGAELPMSARAKTSNGDVTSLQMPNPTYSQTVGSVTTIPHSCIHCHKQYASKAKLLQHQRKKHPDVAPPPQPRHHHERKQSENAVQQHQVVREQPQVQQITVHQVVPQENMPAADLLTQAMSELTQTLNVQEYRPVDYQGMRVINVTHTGHPAMLQQVQSQHPTIEFSHLGPGIVQPQYTQQTPGSPSNQQNMSPQASTQPTTMATGVTYMTTPRWPGYNSNYR